MINFFSESVSVFYTHLAQRIEEAELLACLDVKDDPRGAFDDDSVQNGIIAAL